MIFHCAFIFTISIFTIFTTTASAPSSSSWIHLRSILFVVAHSSPTYCSSFFSDPFQKVEIALGVKKSTLLQLLEISIKHQITRTIQQDSLNLFDSYESISFMYMKRCEKCDERKGDIYLSSTWHCPLACFPQIQTPTYLTKVCKAFQWIFRGQQRKWYSILKIQSSH
ncbi:uncharacterized protein LOC107870665 isoform X1 [Capsicum annuum]|uniref:uncharacterized protein LOC107870665 isoform X1 n=2 Tax=Capsicum annuum TaxID=4072 RepID=UPI001FB11A9D|nr:uncharacterized protein LOC107870665 isoform X1 [Capsicum annuum]